MTNHNYVDANPPRACNDDTIYMSVLTHGAVPVFTSRLGTAVLYCDEVYLLIKSPIYSY